MVGLAKKKKFVPRSRLIIKIGMAMMLMMINEWKIAFLGTR
jgi:hypothetical protein